ncbi:hypothetical protein [Aeromonas sobria]|uniref:hypothetical protein n=1 Tax=Aeromonas sobria TaxID=646 RepID=UPI0011DF8DCD|nr:hypothetical protein [Aeromonas sobria]
MDLGIDKLKAIIGLATDKMAVTLIQDIAGKELSLKKYSYVYNVLIERKYISLTILFSSKEVLKTSYFYTLLSREDGAITISLSDSNNDEVISIEFNADYDFESAIMNYR